MIHLLDPDDPEAPFPPVDSAEREPDGLLALGGDLHPRRLLNAYRAGIFPWYSDGQPLLWWSPDPRTILFPERLKVSRSLRKSLRNKPFQVTFDTAFEAVIDACAAPRTGESGTWITPDMAAAYHLLHRLGHAHSVEVWLDDELAGGLYGIAMGQVFFGESMFSRVSEASKVGFVHLVRQLQSRGYRLVDCQVYTAHLVSLGAEEIPRREFCQSLDRWCPHPGNPGSWSDWEPMAG